MPGEQGILPLLYAATAPEVEGGEYIGLSGLAEIRGEPRLSKGQKKAYNPALRQKLWEKSEQLTQVKF
jgi:hypothetical protein